MTSYMAQWRSQGGWGGGGGGGGGSACSSPPHWLQVQYIYICRTHLSQRIKPMAKTGYIAFVNRSQLSKCYDRLHPAIKRTAAPFLAPPPRYVHYNYAFDRAAPSHIIYVRTYMPRCAARDVIKWAWSNFARAYFSPLFVKILPTPLWPVAHSSYK